MFECEFKVGDLVRRSDSPVVYRITDIDPPAPPMNYYYAIFEPVRKDGKRDRRRGGFSGALLNYVKAEVK